MTFKPLLFSVLMASLSSPLMAQDADDGISFHLGLGAQVQPEYFGSDDTRTGVTGSFDLERFQWGGLSAGGEEKYGLRPKLSARFVAERSSDDYEELTGLEDLDFAVELGGGLAYSAPAYEVFADVRYGVVGHESVVGELGGDVIFRPSDQLTISAGPRLFWGSDDYAQTYFGVTDDEAAASSFEAYEAGSGVLTAGIKTEATYAFNDDWGLKGTLRYDQLQQDAADSPITQSEDQVSASLVVTRRITFGF